MKVRGPANLHVMGKWCLKVMFMISAAVLVALQSLSPVFQIIRTERPSSAFIPLSQWTVGSSALGWQWYAGSFWQLVAVCSHTNRFCCWHMCSSNIIILKFPQRVKLPADVYSCPWYEQIYLMNQIRNEKRTVWYLKHLFANQTTNIHLSSHCMYKQCNHNQYLDPEMNLSLSWPEYDFHYHQTVSVAFVQISICSSPGALINCGHFCSHASHSSSKTYGMSHAL